MAVRNCRHHLHSRHLVAFLQNRILPLLAGRKVLQGHHRYAFQPERYASLWVHGLIQHFPALKSYQGMECPCRIYFCSSSGEKKFEIFSELTHNSPADVTSGSAAVTAEHAPQQLEKTGETADAVTFRSSSRHNLAMIFTCAVCDVRSAKTMSRDTYENGVVIVRCPGCQKLHLIADRLGWFGQSGSVEDFLAAKGVVVRKGSEESYEFSLEDLEGWTPGKKL